MRAPPRPGRAHGRGREGHARRQGHGPHRARGGGSAYGRGRRSRPCSCRISVLLQDRYSGGRPVEEMTLWPAAQACSRSARPPSARGTSSTSAAAWCGRVGLSGEGCDARAVGQADVIAAAVDGCPCIIHRATITVVVVCSRIITKQCALSMCATVWPLHPRWTKRIGASTPELTTWPNSRSTARRRRSPLAGAGGATRPPAGAGSRSHRLLSH